MTLLEDRNLRAHDLWCQALQLSDRDEQIQLLEKSVELDAYRPNVWLALAKCYLRNHRYDDCKRALDMGLLADEHDKFLLQEKLMLELLCGNHPGAIAAIDRMPVPDNPRERNELTRLKVSILIDSSRYDEAIALLRKLTLRSHPSMKDLISLGLLAEQTGDIPLATQAFTRLRNMNPKDKIYARRMEDFFLRHP